MPPRREWIDPGGVRVRLYGTRGPARIRGWLFAIGAAGALFTVARQARIAYFLMPGLQVALGVPAARLLGKCVVMKFSGANEIRRLHGSFVGRTQLRVLRRWARRILVLNPQMFEEAAEAGFLPSQLQWMPNPVDTNVFAPLSAEDRNQLRQQLGLAGNPVVLFVGRLAAEKELPTLIRAFAELRRKTKATLILLGDGPLRSVLEDLAQSEGLGSNVRFTGAADSATVRSYLQASDVFALLSSLEGLPVALLEAMSAGLPAVVSDISANRQLIDHERNGLVTKLGDIAAVTAAFHRLISDHELRQQLGRQARLRVVSSFSTEIVAASYEAMFREYCS